MGTDNVEKALGVGLKTGNEKASGVLSFVRQATLRDDFDQAAQPWPDFIIGHEVQDIGQLADPAFSDFDAAMPFLDGFVIARGKLARGFSKGGLHIVKERILVGFDDYHVIGIWGHRGCQV